MTLKPIKATIWGGLLFLVPLTIAVLILGKLFGFMYQLATPFSEWIPLDSIGGIAIANVVTVILILVISLVAGLVGTSVWGRRLQQSLEEKLLLVFPRYTFVKSLTAHMTSDEVDKVMQPVRVDFDDYTQIAFELERNKEGLVILFLPGSPLIPGPAPSSTRTRNGSSQSARTTPRLSGVCAARAGGLVRCSAEPGK
jgi:uncharacterized membrane protein